MIDRLKFKSKDPNSSIDVDYVDDLSTKSVNGAEEIDGLLEIKEEKSFRETTEKKPK